MRPWLLAALTATVLATGGVALWPADAPEDLLPATRPASRPDARPDTRTTARPESRPDAQAANQPATQPAGAARLQPAPALAAASVRPAPTGRPTTADPTPAQPLLPTRPADWPAPPATALAAWQGPHAPPQAPAPAARPAAAAASAAAPVFPYRWIGQLDDGGTPQVLLAGAQRSVGVRLGATLDGRWRLQLGPGGVLQAQALPNGTPQPVPGAPPAAQP